MNWVGKSEINDCFSPRQYVFKLSDVYMSDVRKNYSLCISFFCITRVVFRGQKIIAFKLLHISKILKIFVLFSFFCFSVHDSLIPTALIALMRTNPKICWFWKKIFVFKKWFLVSFLEFRCFKYCSCSVIDQFTEFIECSFILFNVAIHHVKNVLFLGFYIGP